MTKTEIKLGAADFAGVPITMRFAPKEALPTKSLFLLEHAPAIHAAASAIETRLGKSVTPAAAIDAALEACFAFHSEMAREL